MSVLREGRASQPYHGTGDPQGPTIRGAWGSVWGWDPATQGYTVCIREPHPPGARVIPPPAPEPEPEEEPEPPPDLTDMVCKRGHRGRYHRDADGKLRCRECQRAWKLARKVADRIVAA